MKTLICLGLLVLSVAGLRADDDSNKKILAELKKQTEALEMMQPVFWRPEGTTSANCRDRSIIYSRGR